MPRLTGNQDPAEGSRQTINHELARQAAKQGAKKTKSAKPARTSISRQKQPRKG